jgi:acetate---CoA ligase (ADP-forming)
MRIWGPNCMGIVDIPGKHFFTFMLPDVYENVIIPGRTSLIVQSGMLSAAFIADVMSNRGIGIGKVCSIGNKADVDECDLFRYLLEDAETDAVALYLESVPRGRLFADIARSATKPVVVLKGGKSSAGARAAMSHTSSLAGNSRLLDGVLQSSGIIPADDFHQMIDLAKALSVNGDLGSECRTAILTFSGGGGIVSCDLMEKNGLRVAQLSETTRKALADLYPEWMPVANPVDLYPAIELHGRLNTYDRAISIVLKDHNVDVLLIHYVSGFDGKSLDFPAIKKRADEHGKKVIFWNMGLREPTMAFHLQTQANGMESHGELSRTVECLAAAARYGKKKHRKRPAGIKRPAVSAQDLGHFGLGAHVWDEHESKRLLVRWGISTVEERVVEDPSLLDRTAAQTGFPLVMKGLLPEEVHKTESGLVHVGITDIGEVRQAHEDLSRKMKGRGRVLLQRQLRIDFELIAGYLKDAEFGPCVMFGLGGITAELEPDVTFALAPLSKEEALELMDGIRAKRLLAGFRGMAPLNTDLMTEFLVNLGNLGSACPAIGHIDINPVAVVEGAPVAVDATVILETSGEGPG